MSKEFTLKLQESHGQLWKGPLQRVCLCLLGPYASPLELICPEPGELASLGCGRFGMKSPEVE